MPFSAGTVVLDIWPSLRGVQNAIQREARNIGVVYEKEVGAGVDRVDKRVKDSADRNSGAYATSLRNALNKALKDVGEVKIDADMTEAQRQVVAFKQSAEELLKDLDAHIDIDPAGTLAEVRALQRSAEAILNDVDMDIDVRVNMSQARAALATLQTQLARMDDGIASSNERLAKSYRDAADSAKLVLEARKAEQALATQKAGQTGDVADLAAATAAIRARYEAEEHYSASAARATTADDLKKVATAQITAEQVERAWRDSYDDMTRAAARAAAEQAAISRVTAASQRAAASSAGPSLFQRFQQSNIGQAANSMRLFNGYLLTAVTIGPALIPILASITAGFGGIAVAAGAATLGIGVLVAGFAGIGTAVQALSALDKETRKQTSGSGAGDPAKDTRALRDAQQRLARAREDYGQRIAQAEKNEADAEQNLADARDSAAQRIASANARQADAEKTLTRAVKDAADAQKDLMQARQNAARQLEDMNNQLVSGQLDEQLAYYSLQEAGARYNAVLEDDQATAREKAIAKLQYDQQVQQYKELQIQNQRLTQDVAEANAKGVEGSDQVVAAQERVADANDAVADAQQGVADAAADAAQAQLDAVRQVTDAQQALLDAQADVARAYVEEGRTMADAQQAVADAMHDLQAKTVEAGVAGSAAMDQLREAMSNLSPAGQDFANFLYGLKPFLDTLRQVAQSGILPSLMTLISTIVDKYGDQIISVVGAIAGAFGNLLGEVAEQIQQPWWQEFIQQMFDLAPQLLILLGQIAGAMVTTVSGILKAFAPYAPQILAFIAGIAAGIADWSKDLAGSSGFESFMDYIAETAPKVTQLIGLILEAIVKLGIGLAPYADKILDFMISVFGWIANQKPEDLAKWAVTIFAIVGAIQALAGAMAALSQSFTLLAGVGAGGGILGLLGLGGGAAAGGAVAAGGTAAAAEGTAAAGAATAATPVGWILLAVAAILALAGAIVYLYNTNETFKKNWDAAWEGIGKVVSRIGDGIKWTFENVIAPPFEWLWQNIIKPTFDAIGEVFQIFMDVVTTLGDIIYQVFTYIIAPAIRWLYDNVIAPWWNANVKPIFDALGSYITNNLAPAFAAGVNLIAQIWGTLVDIAKIPVAFVVNTVINKGIIDTFNWLTKYFPGMTPVDHIQLPAGWDTHINIPQWGGSSGGGGIGSGGPNDAYAAGGVLPGYTPRRDVHRFVSPTGGTLDLSGGEGILVPELVRQLGPDWIYENNRRARNGQPLAYADGGILGWLGKGWNAVTDVISGATDKLANFLRDPAGALSSLVDTLLGSDNAGIAGLAAGMARAVVGAVGRALGLSSGSDTGAEPGAGHPGIGWRAMEEIVTAAFPSIAFTSAYRPNAITAVGTKSYHALGRAIDMVQPSMRLFNWLSNAYPDSSELLYTPAGKSQILRPGVHGEPAAITQAQHYSHVHWAYADGGVAPLIYDNGGALPPGLSLVLNKTEKPEQVLTAAQFDDMRRGGGEVHYDFDIENMGYDPADVAQEIEKRRRDRLATSGISEIGVRIG